MKFKTSLILGSLVLLSQYLSAQTTVARSLPARRTSLPIKIDGLIDDDAWKEGSAMSDLTEFRPVVGRKESAENRTETYILYNDEGIYFGGYCHERTKDSIAAELAGRDGFGTNDYIGIIFDTYYDQQNAFEYFITPLGEQWDAKMWPNPNGNNEDFSWNGVWQSGAVIHNDGWSFEMFIPYSAIRFGKKEIQNWGINITRRRRKTEQQYTWNPIDPNKNGFLTQEAIWTGITNIKPPLRLQFSPYIAANTNHFPTPDPADRNWKTNISGGMDVKYGINQAFTLDATLVPDFGQVQSDNRVLNLTPFEIKYTENRPFFTEGTELFTKGNLFYARRIGIDPILSRSAYDGLAANEKVLKNPSESKLINATKISGRTGKGLGIGVLNAVTNDRYATIENTVTGEKRKQLIDPLTNYNVFVLDQTLKHNSSISLVNTNVWRSGSDHEANVTAGLFSFNDKKNMWNLSGKLATSTLFDYLPNKEDQTGYSHSFSFAKTSGSFNFQLNQELTNGKFNSNDLGYFTFTNFLDHSLWIGRRWTKPGKIFNNAFLNFNAYYSRRLRPSAYQNANFNVNLNGQLKNLWYAGGLIGFEPENNDFYEARKPGRVFKGWSSYFFNTWVETNGAKKFMLSTEFLYIKRNLFSSERYSITLSPRYRFSKKLSVNYSLNLSPQNNNVGFAAISGEEVIFGKRDIKSVENLMNIKYSFNDKMNINTRIRHYWSKVDNKQFFRLLAEGDLEPVNNFSGNVNQNYNAFNIDAVFTWQFAPGSFLNFVWKDAAYDFNRVVSDGYFKNFNNTMKADDNNNISIKVIYFLDYLTMKKKWKRK